MMNIKKKIKIVLFVIFVIVLILFTMGVAHIYIYVEYGHEKMHRGMYKSFDTAEALDKSMSRYYDIEIPIMKSTDDIVFKDHGGQYITAFAFDPKDIVFHQKKMRKEATLWISATIGEEVYGCRVEICAQKYDTVYDTPTVISQFEEPGDIENFERGITYIVTVVGVKNHEYRILVTADVLEEPNITKEGAVLITNEIIKAL